MTDHVGIASDERRRTENQAAAAASGYLELCDRCNGTGNELYAMYRRCPKCEGGVIEVELFETMKGIQ